MSDGAIFQNTGTLTIDGGLGFDGETATLELPIPSPASSPIVETSVNGGTIYTVPTEWRSVAMVGFAGSSRERVNEDKAATEVWGLNNGYTFMKRKASMWFDIHGYEGREEYREKHWKQMLELDVPIVALHPPVPRPEGVERFDYTGICQRLGVEPYFTNTIAYMIAYAIDQAVDEIRLYGIDMAVGTEFAHQRACCEYWIGIAKGRGIKVWIAEESPLLRGLLYAVDRNDGFGKAAILDQTGTHKAQYREALAATYQAKGGVLTIKGLIDSFTRYERDHNGITVENIRGIMGASLENAAVEERKAEGQLFTVDGALQADKNLIQKFILPEMSHNEIDMATDPLDNDVNGET